MPPKITAERDGRRIRTKSVWYPKAAAEAKRIPGSSYAETSKTWSYPLDLFACRALRRVYGDRLVIGPELWAWAQSERRMRRRLRRLGRSHDTPIERVPEIAPILAKAMEDRRYQKAGARFAAIARRSCIADQPGLGKTTMSLAALMEAELWEGRHLVVAPKVSLHPTWERQIHEWTDGVAVAVPEGRAARAEAIDRFLALDSGARFLCVNPAMLRVKMAKYCSSCRRFEGEQPWSDEHHWMAHKTSSRPAAINWPGLLELDWDSVIVDESHDLLAAYKPSNVSQTVEGLMRLRTKAGGLRLALTGTPLRGHESRQWGMREWLGINTGGYWAWIDQYFEIVEDAFGRTIGGILDERLEEFGEEIDAYMLRRTKREVRPDLPEKDVQPVWVTMSPRHRKLYQRFAIEGEMKLKGGVIAGLGVLSELSRVKQLAYGTWTVGAKGKLTPGGESPKAEWLLDALAERGVTGNPKTDFLPEEGVGHKYVVASQWTEVIDDLARRLAAAGIRCEKITGKITGKARDAVAHGFQNSYSGPRVLLLNTYAGGVSLDLDHYCDEMFIMDETFVADDQEQLEGRIDNRSGRVANRTFWYVRTEDTIEEQIAKTNIGQDELQKDLLDRRRGAQAAERLLGIS